MPIESSKAQIGRNLDLDLGAYIQGKSFTRSVSISESSSTPATNSSDSVTGSLTPYPTASTGRFASGPTGSHASPSPLSSTTTTTISPDSPLPSASIAAGLPFPLPGAQLNTSMATGSEPPSSLSLETSPVGVTALSTNGVDPSPGYSRLNDNSRATHQTNSPYRPEFQALFRSPAAQRTVMLLSHLVDSRLQSDWREAMLMNPEHQCSATPNRPPSITLDTADGFGSAVRRPIPPSPTDDATASVVLKRFKRNDDDENQDAVEAGGSDGIVLGRTRSEPCPPRSSTSSPAFIPVRLVDCVCRLADHFESRYRDKLGDLMADVARLSAVDNTPSDNGAELTDGASSELDGTTSIPSSSSSDVDNATDYRSRSEVVGGDAKDLLCIARGRFHRVLRELFSERVNWGRVIAMLAFVRALCEHIERGDLQTPLVESASPHSNTRTEMNANNGNPPPVQNETNASSASPSSPTRAPQPVTDEFQTNGHRGESDTSRPTDSLDGSALVGSMPRLRAAHYIAWTAEFIHGPHGISEWIQVNGDWNGLTSFESDRGIWNPATGVENALLGFMEEDAIRLLGRAVTGVATLAVGAVGLVAMLRYFTKRA